MLQVRALGIWLLILALAVANGVLREAVLIPNLPRPTAFVLSGLLLIGCVFGTSMLLIPRLGSLSPKQCWLIGTSWLALTLAFEFGFGYLVRGASLEQLMSAYTFRDGNIWPLVLAAVLLSPRVAGSKSPVDARRRGKRDD